MSLISQINNLSQIIEEKLEENNLSLDISINDEGSAINELERVEKIILICFESFKKATEGEIEEYLNEKLSDEYISQKTPIGTLNEIRLHNAKLLSKMQSQTETSNEYYSLELFFLNQYKEFSENGNTIKVTKEISDKFDRLVELYKSEFDLGDDVSEDESISQEEAENLNLFLKPFARKLKITNGGMSIFDDTGNFIHFYDAEIEEDVQL